jgi:hypothetical protein
MTDPASGWVEGRAKNYFALGCPDVAQEGCAPANHEAKTE